MSNIKLIKSDSVPKCPYCDKLLESIEKTHTGMLGSSVVYICPHCKKLLSIGING